MTKAFDKAPFYFLSFSEEGKIIAGNTSLCKDLGYEEEELIGRPVDILFTLPTRIFCQTHLFPLLKLQHKAEEIHISFLTRNKKQVPVLLNAARYETNEEVSFNIAGIVVHNRQKYEDELIAARKRVEEALTENTDLIRMRAELEDHAKQLDNHLVRLNNQNSELKQFNKVVTHDLQEPLRKLLFYSGMLLDDKESLPEKSAYQISRLKHISSQMHSIVSGLQKYVWLTENNIDYTRINLSPLLAEVQQQVNNEFGEDLCRVEITELPELDGDREQLKLLFHLILTNSVVFRKPGEPAHVTIHATELKQNSFRNSEGKYHYTDYVKIDIIDQGIGFDTHYRHQIFDLFKRLHKNSGRGIGLALCKKIVENHFGQIEANSHPDAGTTITIVVPQNRVINGTWQRSI